LGRDAEVFQALVLPVRQLRPDRVLALSGEPPSDVHGMAGDSRLQFGQPGLVTQQLPYGGVVALPVGWLRSLQPAT
jgi:hypothetical protein